MAAGLFRRAFARRWASILNVSTALRRERATILRNNRHNPSLEESARTRQLAMPLDDVRRDWISQHWPRHLRDITRHYGIYLHLFGGREFLPDAEMRIEYDNSQRVQAGNHISPANCQQPPTVQYESAENVNWTLLMTNPDGNLYRWDAEVLHWLVCNIPGNRVADGTVHCPYLPPIPVKGTGFHRVAFILFRQKGVLKNLTQSSMKDLPDRTFMTERFLYEHRALLEPAGLQFFQAQWDESVSQTFDLKLGITEPTYDIERATTARKKRQRKLKRVFSNKHRSFIDVE
eukprot:m.8300 g.8300  ORF g.8300 m.8300 type:complete len:289 (+) comp20480_c0_seq2:19-885(+)